MTTLNTQTPSLVVTMDKANAKFQHQVSRAAERNAIIAELETAGVSIDAIKFRNIPAMFPIVELADMLALKLDGRAEFKAGTVESYVNYGTAIQSLGVDGFKKTAKEQSNAVKAKTSPQSSDGLLKASVLQAIDERVSLIRDYYLVSLTELLDNPAAYLADHANKLDLIGVSNLDSFAVPLDLPIVHITSLLQAEKYSAQLEQFATNMPSNYACNFRIVEGFLVCDGKPSDTQRTALEESGYTVTSKDTSSLESEAEQALKAKDWELAKSITSKVIEMQAWCEIRKPLAV